MYGSSFLNSAEKATDLSSGILPSRMSHNLTASYPPM